MKVDRLPPVTVSLQPNEHPYMNGAWTPLHEEVDAFDLDVIEGTIPTDIDGVYVRNTENPVHQPLGRYHPFDGDGMLHQISFRDGRADGGPAGHDGNGRAARSGAAQHQTAIRLDAHEVDCGR